MPIEWLFNQPSLFLAWICAVVIGLTIHEFSHALVSLYYGDKTAADMGRTSLNPLVHIDPIGFSLLLLVGFGWAKPVPINVYNLRNPRLATAMISLAGPGANLVGAVVFGLLFKFLAPSLGPYNLLSVFLDFMVLINVMLMIFNLIPIPPLDGSKVLFSILPDKYDDFKQKFSINGPFILLGLILVDNFINNGRFFGSIFAWIFAFLSKILM